MVLNSLQCTGQVSHPPKEKYLIPNDKCAKSEKS